MDKIKGLTLTILANMTSNYGESLGNVSGVQKVFRNGNTYAMRSRESLKNAVMVQSGMYDDLSVTVDGATQKEVSKELNASNCRALEGGYMNTNVVVDKNKLTFIRNSSFYLTDAISCEPFVNETRFHNNLHLAKTYAKTNDLNVQNNAKETGLMPYNYEYEKSLRAYSITFDLEIIGKDENFDGEADSEEKATRVNAILEAIEQLSLVVKGNLDNAEPIFIVGGLSDRKTHVFENVVRVNKG
ncbi:MAG: type I-B CRISPR-associated protein Cas7/Cst2/DevR, partial [Defluviitaleaceae bacterium]|nr:type I-B CRISPR-associated protein Cas7/Cst2/DevR [Defluviitaleaceae bacterium]